MVNFYKSKFFKFEIIFFLVAFFLDLASKLVVDDISFSGFFSFSVTQNTGMAFSLFNFMPGFVLILNLIFFILLVYIWIKEKIKYLGFVVGGALGNLIERIFFGHVTDFIRVGDFPIFNVGDSFISAGIAIIIFLELKRSFIEYHKKK